MISCRNTAVSIDPLGGHSGAERHYLSVFFKQTYTPLDLYIPRHPGQDPAPYPQHATRERMLPARRTSDISTSISTRRITPSPPPDERLRSQAEIKHSGTTTFVARQSRQLSKQLSNVGLPVRHKLPRQTFARRIDRHASSPSIHGHVTSPTLLSYLCNFYITAFHGQNASGAAHRLTAIASPVSLSAEATHSLPEL